MLAKHVFKSTAQLETATNLLRRLEKFLWEIAPATYENDIPLARPK
jgi:hypothetical protein